MNEPVWISALAGIVGAIVGAIASLLPAWVIESRRVKHEAELVEASLISEILAIADIAKERKYLESLADAIRYLEAQPNGAVIPFSVNIPAHYSRVYQANAYRIGTIEQSKATDIIRFHQFIDAVVQDLMEGGALASGGDLEAFRENFQILSRAMEIARKYANGT